MTLPTASTLPPVPYVKCSLEDPGREHFCQIHHDEESLVDAVSRFTQAGLQAGDVVSLLLPESRQEKIFHRLREWGMHVDAAVRAGRIVVARPAEFRQRCFEHGVLDHEAFKQSFRETFALGGAAGRIRVYGEISNQFWHEGDVATAITLDRLCNEVLAERRVAVFCGYLLDGLAPSSYIPALEHLCRIHCDIPETPEDPRLRAAIDTASVEVIGIPLSVTLNRARAEQETWWRRLPLGRRTIAWLQENIPSAMLQILEKARVHYR